MQPIYPSPAYLYTPLMVPSLAKGREVVKMSAKALPLKPGVYHMVAQNGEILYIGKAKYLQKRVLSYANTAKLPYRLQRMVSLVDHIDIIVVSSEAEALLLEARLIKKHQPKYNILLKDGKSYPYIYIDDDAYPRLTKFRGKQTKKGHFFGPFPSGAAVSSAITDLQKAFLLRPCTNSFFASRQRPCLEYQIKRCSGPCVDKISQQAYKKLVKEACQFLQGKNDAIFRKLTQEMNQASANTDYERAASLRDRIAALRHIITKQTLDITGVFEADIIGYHQQGDLLCASILSFRGGLHFGVRYLYLSFEEGLSISEILRGALLQFYQDNVIPKSVMVSPEIEELSLLASVLTLQAEAAVIVVAPKQGDKKRAVDIAMVQAKEACAQKARLLISQGKMLQEVQKLFSIEECIERIELYDNSHLQGSNACGAFVVAGPEGFEKQAYRLFNFKEADTSDDYAMMQEVVSRRLKRLAKEPTVPQLMIFDGGKGHMTVIKKIFEEQDITHIPYACMAKGKDRNAGKETFYFPDGKSFSVNPGDPVMLYLQRLRDEVHHFVIRSHRKKRDKQTKKSSLDIIPGVGKTRKIALLKHFGSLEMIKQASVTELVGVKGISKELAASIHEALKQ